MTIDEIFEHAEKLCLLAVDNPERWLHLYKEAMVNVRKHEHNGWKRNTGMTQNQKIIKHLNKAGSITVREAMIDYSIQSFTKRISELRDAGYDIIGEMKTHPLTKQRYMRYTMA
jgi:hypothetical protein